MYITTYTRFHSKCKSAVKNWTRAQTAIMAVVVTEFRMWKLAMKAMWT